MEDDQEDDQDENEEEQEEEEDDEVPDLPEEFMFDAEGGLQDKDVMQFAQSVNRQAGARGAEEHHLQQRPRAVHQAGDAQGERNAPGRGRDDAHRRARPKGAP